MTIDPCPECDNKKSVVGFQGTHKHPKYDGYCKIRLSCTNCGLHTGSHGLHKDAIEEWNKIVRNYPK